MSVIIEVFLKKYLTYLQEEEAWYAMQGCLGNTRVGQEPARGKEKHGTWLYFFTERSGQDRKVQDWPVGIIFVSSGEEKGPQLSGV